MSDKFSDRVAALTRLSTERPDAGRIAIPGMTATWWSILGSMGAIQIRLDRIASIEKRIDEVSAHVRCRS